MRFNLMTLLAMACAAIPLQTAAATPSSFTPPDLAGYTLEGERDVDGDSDGLNETHIRHYLNEAGDSLVSLSIRDVIWAWSLNTHNDESAVRNYVIRDSDCDGVFDEVYSLDEEFNLPDCMK